MKKPINIGIFAHIDAGKTSLTENLLFENNAISKLGKVNTGTTQTDKHFLEKQKGITIKSSVVSFSFENFQINIIDTPGYSDFIAEVKRNLEIIDFAVLVISATSGIQAQTKILTKYLKHNKIPTIIFVNKIDQNGINFEKLFYEIKENLFENIYNFTIPNFQNENIQIVENQNYEELFNILSKYDDQLLEKVLSEKIFQKKKF